jgi:hypothetical protein
MRIQPIDLETGAIFLAAPAAAALYVENIHMEPATTAVVAILSCRAAFFENVIVDRIYSLKRFPCDFRAWHTHSKCFFHADHQLERVDGIQTESIRAKKWKIVCNLFRGDLKHQVFYKHLFDAGA